MRLAVFADVHANLPALEAVTAEIAKLRLDGVICLGDIVGYGAHVPECIARVQELADVVIAGNHDVEVVSGSASPGTQKMALATQAFTRSCLNAGELAFLGSLPSRCAGDGYHGVHGSFLNDHGTYGYVTSSMLEPNLLRIAERPDWAGVGLCAHTHVPLAGWLTPAGARESDLREPIEWPAGGAAVLINPGSVGQPRDGDARAAFAVIDLAERRARVVRVPYDTQRAANAIIAAGLPRELGDRLHEGR